MPSLRSGEEVSPRVARLVLNAIEHAQNGSLLAAKANWQEAARSARQDGSPQTAEMFSNEVRGIAMNLYQERTDSEPGLRVTSIVLTDARREQTISRRKDPTLVEVIADTLRRVWDSPNVADHTDEREIIEVLTAIQNHDPTPAGSFTVPLNGLLMFLPRALE